MRADILLMLKYIHSRVSQYPNNNVSCEVHHHEELHFRGKGEQETNQHFRKLSLLNSYKLDQG